MIGAAFWLLTSFAPQPAAAPRIARVENAGLLFTDNRAGVTGTDAGYSIPLGRQTLWLFGDVFLLDPSSPEKRNVRAVSNCGLLVPTAAGTAAIQKPHFLTGPDGRARQLLTSRTVRGENLRFWPFGGWYDAAAKRVYLYYARVRTTGMGAFAFKTEGFGLASADAAAPDRIGFEPLPARSGEELWWPNVNGKPTFGSAVVANCPGPYVYVVGVQERNRRKFGKMARVLKSKMTDPAAYEYFAGGERWSRSLDDAGDVEGLADFPSELSISYNAYLGGYLAVHSVGITERARLCLAPNPWGPYRTIGEISTPKRPLSQGFCYAGKEHPELAEEGGRVIYMTYVDSSIYWLHLLKVTLQK